MVPWTKRREDVDKKKVWKRKKLYKVFEVENDGTLKGPYQNCKYYRKVGIGAGVRFDAIKVSNAKGWLSHVENNPRICERGWHAYDLENLGNHVWDGERFAARRAVFEVILKDCFAGGRKWVGTQMKILRRYSREEYRGWQRDQKRARRA